MKIIVCASPHDLKLYMVSDGSKIDNSMSFGWMFGTNQGTQLAENNGPGYGTPTSHQAEGWGHLSGARFLLHLSAYTRTPFPPSLQLESICDNAGLILRLQNRRKYTVVYANATLEPDWDITEQIHDTYNKIGSPAHAYHWVKGHQDDDQAYNSLPIPAKYNIHADELADEYMDAFGCPRLLSPTLPACKCSLQLAKTTHQGHYSRVIREAVATPPLLKYMAKKYDWTSAVRSQVDWGLFNEAANNYAASDNHLLKLVHDQLPTRSNKARFETWVSPNCPHCHVPETFDHIMQCSHSPVSLKFWSTFPIAILAYCAKQKAPAEFTNAITHAARSWLNGNQVLRDIPTLQRMHPAIHSQSLIGWRCFLKGLISCQWTTYLRADVARNYQGRGTRLDTHSFLVGLIKLMWTHQSTLWTDHLTQLHRKDISLTSPSKQIELQAQIRQLHERRNDTLAAHRNQYFHSDLEHYLSNATIFHMKTYVSNYGRRIYASIKEAQKVNSTSLLQYAGYARTAPNQLGPARAHTTNVATETPQPHDHVRWRPLQQVRESFQKFFTQP